jgi:hypothetical protein
MKKFIIAVIALFYSFTGVNMLFAGIWTQKADFREAARASAVGFSIGTKGYIGTGWDGKLYYKDFWEYDPATNIWTQKADFGGVARASAVGFSVGTKGYIGTGAAVEYERDFWEYDPATNIWTQKADFGGAARASAVGFSIGTKGYIGTGWDGKLYYKDFWEYDPATNIWTQKADFGLLVAAARKAVVGFAIGTKGYIGTGIAATGYTDDFWEYNPAGNTWTQMTSFGGTKRGSAVGFSIGTKGYIGTGIDGSGYTKDFWEYDPAGGADLGTWTVKADFGGTARKDSVGFLIASKGYIGTGIDGSGYTKDLWEYDPAGINSIPNQFIFTDQTNVQLSTVITSNTITVSGIDAVLALPIAITGGTYAINGGSYTSVSGTVNNGNTVTLRQTSSGSSTTTTNAILTIGGVSDTFSVATVDMIPDQFTFSDQTGVDIITVVTSNTITVSGITGAAPISITGGKYSINGGSYTKASGTVSNGSTVQVQQTSSSIYTAKTDATLTIGGVSDTFSVTTKATSASGGGCFIATTAFGSPLAGQVEILRQFRDRYLLTNSFGKKFVAWYYRNGPVAASWIKDKPLAKAAVQVALYPLICFSLLLISGYLPLVTVGLLLSTLIFLCFRPKKLISK